VKDVCRATTAAPTFLPPVDFTVPPTKDTEVRATPSGEDEDKRETDKTKVDDAPTGAENKPTQQFNMIDGGIAANNPVGFSSNQAYFLQLFINKSDF